MHPFRGDGHRHVRNEAPRRSRVARLEFFRDDSQCVLPLLRDVAHSINQLGGRQGDFSLRRPREQELLIDVASRSDSCTLPTSKEAERDTLAAVSDKQRENSQSRLISSINLNQRRSESRPF